MSAATNRLSRMLSAPRQVARYAWHRLRTKATYADDREDELVWFLLGGIRTFVDVGANDGITCSNTVLASLRGARGLCFEPNPLVYRSLAAFYAMTPRVECIPEGLSDAEGVLKLRCDGLLSTITATEDATLAGLLQPYARSGAEVVDVQVSRLASWIARRPLLGKVDLMSIDVEGHELRVLNGIDWPLHPTPTRAFVIETHAAGERGSWRHQDMNSIVRLLEDYQYVAVAESRNNTIWLRGDDVAMKRIQEAKIRFQGLVWL
jgi:FkbM family methyltransferase